MWMLEDLGVLGNSEHLPPLLQAAVVHAQFETIHPFDDGSSSDGNDHRRRRQHHGGGE
jgi:hypothetical protein